jgi:uncharacterized protein
MISIPASKGFDRKAPLSTAFLEKSLAQSRLPAHGEVLPAECGRIASSATSITRPIRWTFAPGDVAPSLGRPRRRWWLMVEADVNCICERCMAPVVLSVHGRRGFEFFASAQQADVMTDQVTEEDEHRDPELAEIDFLSPEDDVTLTDLIEEEVLLSLPMSPRHPACTPDFTSDPGPEQAKTQPFAGLAALKDRLKKS